MDANAEDRSAASPSRYEPVEGSECGSTDYSLVNISTGNQPGPCEEAAADAGKGDVRRPLTPAQIDALTRLGLTSDDFAFFFRRFIGHPFEFVTRFPDGNWQLVRDRPLNNSLLIAHLRGDRWVGTGARRERKTGKHHTDYFVIDLDCAGPDDDLFERYDAVVDALGLPGMLFRSSSSNGLHLYYFLSTAIDLHRLRRPDGTGGAVIELLAAQSLPEQAGRVEVYPRGAYRARGVQQRLRLPFGRDSRLLDPVDLLPVARTAISGSGVHALRRARDLWDDGQVPLIDPPDLLERAKSVGVRTRVVERVRLCAPATAVGSCLDAQALWESGLTRAKQFNEAVLSLAIDLRRTRRADDPETATVLLTAWLEAKHNGWSGSYNRDPEAARAEIAQVVARVYSRAILRKSWVPLPDLSAYEVVQLLRCTGTSDDLIDPKTGEVLSRCKVEQVGFAYLQGAKQWVLTTVRDLYARTSRDLSGTEDHRPAFISAMSRATRWFWPEPSAPEFVVPVPYALRARGTKGVSEEAHRPIWRALEALGVVSKVRCGSAWAHRAATFRVALDFGVMSTDDRTFGSLAGAVIALRSADDLGKLYTRHYRKKLRDQVRAERVEVRPQDPPFERYLRWMLRASQRGEGVAA